MTILVTNDDGIYGPGIATLARVAAKFGDVRVVAPDVEMSSASHAITSSRPLRYRRTRLIEGVEAYRVNGTPADCVALGTFLAEGGVDVVLSGVNLGLNLGNALWHSGTLAAAKQAVLLGLRGIALSAPADEESDLSAFAPWVERVLQLLLGQDAPRLVNVNFPKEPHGLHWTAQAVDQYDGKVVPDTDPMGREHYWFTVIPLERHREGTDLWATEVGLVSLTPLRLDLTDRRELARFVDTNANSES